jgi:integrase
MQRLSSARVSGHVKLVERKRGAKWYVKFRLANGRQVQRCLGPAWTDRGRPPAGHYTKKLAEEALREILTDAQRGTLAGLDKSGVTFADAAAEFVRYASEVRQVDDVTVRDYRGVIDGYLLDAFGSEALESITPDMIDSYKEDLIAERRLSNRTIVRHLTVLHGIFKRAKRVWGLQSNPAAAELVERPKVTYTGEFDTLDPDEVEQLAAAAANEQDAAIYKTAAFSGLRQGELLALRWKHVDFVGGLVHVRRNYTDGREKVPKGKRVRSVPMMPELIDVLAKLKERDVFTSDDDLVFCTQVGEHLDPFALRRRYYRALERAGLRRVRFHDLRHAFGSAAITKLDPYAVQSYMGHQHYSTTQRYLHHKPRREDAAALQEAFGRTASPAGTGRAPPGTGSRDAPEREHSPSRAA